MKSLLMKPVKGPYIHIQDTNLVNSTTTYWDRLFDELFFSIIASVRKPVNPSNGRRNYFMPVYRPYF